MMIDQVAGGRRVTDRHADRVGVLVAHERQDLGSAHVPHAGRDERHPHGRPPMFEVGDRLERRPEHVGNEAATAHRLAEPGGERGILDDHGDDGPIGVDLERERQERARERTVAIATGEIDPRATPWVLPPHTTDHRDRAWCQDRDRELGAGVGEMIADQAQAVKGDVGDQRGGLRAIDVERRERGARDPSIPAAFFPTHHDSHEQATGQWLAPWPPHECDFRARGAFDVPALTTVAHSTPIAPTASRTSADADVHGLRCGRLRARVSALGRIPDVVCRRQHEPHGHHADGEPARAAARAAIEFSPELGAIPCVHVDRWSKRRARRHRHHA
ncbi:MAG: hypothetical protein NT062_15425 [Proteobacteria bacterium]|nr:hypothetical protein [Pseudomonadota bacterium]